MRQIVATLALTFALLAACENSSAPDPAAGPSAPGAAAPKRIAVVPKGTTHEYWKSIHAGALKAEKDLGGIAITFRGPEKEDDREQQIGLVQNLIASRYDAIVLAPLDHRALVGPVRQATSAGIPVVIMDSGIDASAGKDYVAFVATDNEEGGRIAGKKMAELMAGKDKPAVLILRYQEGSASTALREKGFLDGLAAASPAVRIIDPGRYAGSTRASAQEAAENLLSANAGIDGVFCPNESSTFGMMLALRSRGLAGKVAFIGFDSSKELVDAMRGGEIAALVVQNPIRMGYLAVKAAADHLAARPVEAHQDTGVAIIIKETMDEPQNRELLSPDLEALLGTR